MEYIYAALLLHKLGQPVNEENITKVIKSTGAQVDDAKIKTLLAALKGVDIEAELEKAPTTIAAPAGEAKVEDKPVEEEKEKPAESAAGLASLFG